MKQLLKYLLLGFFLLLTPNTTYAYNNSWSSHEDVTKPCPGPGCDKKCKNPCGCNADGTPKECECKPSPTVCCLNNPPTDKTSSPVYSKNGAFTWSDTDISLISKPRLSLKRTYTAYDAHLGLFGNAWISDFEKLFIETVKYSKDNNGTQSTAINYTLRLPNGARYAYKYDENNHALIDTGKLKVQAKKIDEHHATLTYKNGLVETYEDGYLIEKKDKSGNRLALTYDTTHLLQSVQSGTASLTFTYNTNGFVSEVTDQTGRIWNYNYDDNGNLIDVTNPLGGTKTYTYQAHKDSFDAQVDYLITNISDEEGKSIVSTTYNSDGRVHSYTEGTLTYTYTYVDDHTIRKTDNEGNVLTFVMDDDGFIVKRIDALNHSTEDGYDEANRTATTIDANGNKWIKKQDEMGRVIASIDPLGNSTTYSYDGNNTRPKTITTPLGHSTTITYDATQNPLTITDAKGNTQSFKYDAKGNATEITDAKGNKTTIAYNSNNQPISITNALNNTTTITYDALGRQQSITDPDGRITTYEYDAMERIVKSTDAIRNIIEYTYDKAGRLTTLKDPAGNEIKYDYDTYRRVTTETRADGGVTHYTYNTDNTIKSITRRDGKVVTYTYNASKWPTSQNVDGDTIYFTYDAQGNTLTATNNNGTISFMYNEMGKLTKETQLGIDISTSYDTENHIKTLSFLNQTINYTRDNLGLATSINNDTFTYDANGIQTQLTYPNNTSEQSTFDAVYNIQQIQTANETINYTQDKTGLITSKNSTNYTYDDIGRLTQVTSTGSVTDFAYDKAGNNLNNNAVYNILNNQLNTSDFYTITYDSMGNIKTKYNKLTKTTSNYTFNSRNQLVNYEQLGDANQTIKTLTYTYDAFNRRVSKIEDGVTQKYLYDGNNIVAILDGNNMTIATITHDENVDTPLSITNRNGTFYYHRDHQGSIIALTDSSGAVVESFTYDNHYGTITNHTKTTETNNPYAYTGRELDTPEIYYYRARYYDPTMQRFISEDPIGFGSQEFNLYRYVSSSPINFMDASGNKISGFWAQSPSITDYGYQFDGWSLIHPYVNDWYYFDFVRVFGSVHGTVSAVVHCQDDGDECRDRREWNVHINLDVDYSGHFDAGPNLIALYISLKADWRAAIAANIAIAAGAIGANVYKIKSKWGDKAQRAYDTLIQRGPTALCIGTSR